MTVDMSPEAISARLRTVAELSDLDRDLRMHGKVDYSPEAVSARLREVEQLRRLCLALGRRRDAPDAV
jgi:hypothetical protein